MSDAKHTEGPWTFDRDWNRIPTIIGADGSLVADIRKSSVNKGGGVVDMPEREANARLIAAAPELLAALIPLAASPRGLEITIGQLDAARAAIAKAKGFQP